MINARVIRLSSFLHTGGQESEILLSRVLQECTLKIEEGYSNLLLFVETGGTEGRFLQEVAPLLKANKTHLYILASPSDNALAASLEIRSYLKRYYFDSKVTLLAGSFEEIKEQIETEPDQPRNNTSLYYLKKNINLDMRLGVIGKPSNWLIASYTNYDLVYQRFGIKLLDIDGNELNQEIEKTDYIQVIRENPAILEYVGVIINQNMAQSIQILGALLKLVKKYHLNGFTIRCFDLLSLFKGTSCFALAYLNAKGIISTCEGDVPSLVTMALVSRFYQAPSFQANPSSFNFTDDTMILSHCSIPLNMCEKIEYLSHYESKLGIGIRGQLSLGEVTILKLNSNFDQILYVRGEAIKNHCSSKRCRSQIEIKTEHRALVDILNSNVQNHLVLAYGNLDALLDTLK